MLKHVLIGNSAHNVLCAPIRTPNTFKNLTHEGFCICGGFGQRQSGNADSLVIN